MELYDQAKALHIAGDPDQAIPIYRQVIELDNDCVPAINMLGNAYLDLGDIEQALAQYDEAVNHDPDFYAAHYNRGNALCELERPKEAIPAYRRAIELNPDFVPAHFNLGNTYLDLDHPDKALDAYQEAAKLDRQDHEIHFNLGKALKELERNDEAMDAFSAAVDLHPQFSRALSEMGECLLRTGRPLDAMMWFRRASAAAPDAAVEHFNIAKTHFALGQYDDAEAAYRRAMELDPTHVRTIECLSRTLVYCDRRDEALELVDRWLELEPDNPRAVHLRDAWSGTDSARASEGYVRQEFDAFAEEFDVTLRQLGYRVPEILAGMLAATRGSEEATGVVVDIGCGTGLSGVPVRPYADKLIGVDLSEQMLLRARRRDVYDVLITDDLTRYLKRNIKVCEAIISADTFIYFGDLAEVIADCAATLNEGGLLVFSVEAHDAPDIGATFQLKPSGRYGHHEPYVREVLDASGLTVLEFDEIELREERGRPIVGYAVVAQKPRSN